MNIQAGEDGKIRERYIPSEDGEDEIFKSAIGAGINFDTFDAVPLQVGFLVCKVWSEF